MEKATRSIDTILGELFNLKLSFANNMTKQRGYHVSMIARYITNKELKALAEIVEKQDKDFQYLKKPSFVPQAYNQALIEITRRRKFRTILE